MVRQKVRATKKVEKPSSSITNSASTNLTSTSSDLPKIFEHEFRRAQHRFIFNVDQIEQKYKNSTSGLVFNLDKNKEEEIEFDPEFCTAENDEQLIGMINQQTNYCIKGPIGDALISTPAPDPEQQDKNEIERWKKLNKDFEAKYTKKMKEQDSNKKMENKQKDFENDGKENAEQQQRRCTALVKYDKRAVDPSRSRNIQLDIVLRTSTNSAILETFKLCGGFDAISTLLNQQKLIKLPPTIKHKMLSIEGKMDEDEEKGEEEEWKDSTSTKRRKVDSFGKEDDPSTSYGKAYSPPKKRSTRFSLFEPKEDTEPIITIPETPLSKMGYLDREEKSFRMTIDDEIVEQTPPEKFRQTPFNSQFNQKIRMTTPFNKINAEMPIVQTLPSTNHNLETIQSIASRTRTKAIKECELKQHAMASQMIEKAISRIQGIVHQNEKLSDLQGVIKNSFRKQIEEQYKAAQQNQRSQGIWLQRKRTKTNPEFMVNEEE